MKLATTLHAEPAYIFDKKVQRKWRTDRAFGDDFKIERSGFRKSRHGLFEEDGIGFHVS